MRDLLSSQVVDLTPYYGVIRVSGPAAFSFLQGQLTCDMREVNTTTLQLGGFCNHQGRLRALFKIFKKLDPHTHEEIFYLKLPKSLLPTIIVQLKKVGLFSKVTIEEVDDIQIFGWQEGQKRLKSQGAEQNSAHFLKQQFLKQISSEIQQATPSQITLLKAPDPLFRFQLIGPKPMMAVLWDKLASHAVQHPFAEWCLEDIRQGIPEVWSKTTEQFFPHHLNLPELKAVSFTKGCYCGQEIVARMHYRGNLKRGMVRGVLSDCHEINEVLSPGTELLVQDNPADILKVITAVPYSGKMEALIEMPKRLLPEQTGSQTFKIHIGSNPSLKELTIQPFRDSDPTGTLPVSK